MSDKWVPVAALAAATVVAAPRSAPAMAPQPQTLTTTAAPVRAFAQDGRYIAWIERGGACGNRLRIRALPTRRTTTLARIACRGSLATDLALANQRVLWRVDEISITNTKSEVAVRTAALADARIRDTRWLVAKDVSAQFPLAGSGNLLAYYAQDDEEEEYAVWRVRPGGSDRKLFDVEAAIDLSVHGDRIAFVVASSSPRGGVRTASGRRVAGFRLAGTPIAVALSASRVSVLTKTGTDQKQVEVFDSRSGAVRGTSPLPAGAAPVIAATDRWVVFAVEGSVRARNAVTNATNVLARTRGLAIGLSVEAGRVAWAENVGRRGRIRAVRLPRL